MKNPRVRRRKEILKIRAEITAPVFLREKFHGQKSLVASVCGVAKSQT